MDLKKTITSIFIVPTLGINKENLKDNQYLNGYLSDSRKETVYKDCVYLLFNPENLDRFREFLESEQQRTKDVIDDYDYENGYVVLVYKLNPKWKDDIDIIKTSKYSKTSDAYQRLFPKIIKVVKNGITRDETSMQYRIFKKSDDLTEYWQDKLDVVFTENMEVWSAMNMDDEILNIDNIKQEQLKEEEI